jgi:hypothetical protein
MSLALPEAAGTVLLIVTARPRMVSRYKSIFHSSIRLEDDQTCTGELPPPSNILLHEQCHNIMSASSRRKSQIFLLDSTARNFYLPRLLLWVYHTDKHTKREFLVVTKDLIFLLTHGAKNLRKTVFPAVNSS